MFTFHGEGIDVRINVNIFAAGEVFPKDPFHYHETRTTYFVVLTGELYVEVQEKGLVTVTNGQLLVIEPNEIYRTAGFGSEGVEFIVVGSHAQSDRVVVASH